ncbi:MAG: hypothetical protein ACF8AM_11355, partial [Rhodopirellula sp. JB055]
MNLYFDRTLANGADSGKSDLQRAWVWFSRIQQGEGPVPLPRQASKLREEQRTSPRENRDFAEMKVIVDLCVVPMGVGVSVGKY